MYFFFFLSKVKTGLPWRVQDSETDTNLQRKFGTWVIARTVLGKLKCRLPFLWAELIVLFSLHFLTLYQPLHSCLLHRIEIIYLYVFLTHQACGLNTRLNTRLCSSLYTWQLIQRIWSGHQERHVIEALPLDYTNKGSNLLKLVCQSHISPLTLDPCETSLKARHPCDPLGIILGTQISETVWVARVRKV